MKKFRSLKIIAIVAILISIFPTNSKALSATVGFSGNSTVVNGNNITITMYVSNVSDANGGIVSLGGNLSFNSEYLEYVSGTGASTPYQFQINTNANYKIAGLDTTLSNGITGSGQTTVFTFVFKAKKVGTTNVTFINATASDTKAKFPPNIVSKSITITDSSSGPNPGPGDTKSSDATLKSLSASGYTLSPSFNPQTTSYTITVPSDATFVTLTGQANDSKANVTGLGNITLTGNTTTATIKVTAEDGTTKTYTVNIVKDTNGSGSGNGDNNGDKSSDATLKSLDVSGYTLTPQFDKNVNSYSMKVQNTVTGLNVTAIPTDPNAKVTITGNLGWKEGLNVITIKVTAEDGTTNIYLVNVTREGSSSSSSSGTSGTTKSSDNYLSDLIIHSSHDISPKFSSLVSNYNITVPYEVEKLDLEAIAKSSTAKVKITGNENFKVGQVNVVQIEVTAEDGSVRIYTLNVTRSTASSNDKLGDLVVKGADLHPKFDPDTPNYELNVDGDVNDLDITATPADPDSKVEIIGNGNFKEGHNTVLIKVTDKNGFTRYYTLDVVKSASKKSTILGLTPLQFWIMTGILLFGLLFFLLLLLLLLRRKDEKEEQKPVAPIIEVKPEFNFSSKNTSDDDIVHGNFNQNSDLEYKDKKEIPYTADAVDAYYEEHIPYDPYDEIVTKDELIDALKEATETHDTTMLDMLLEQEALNQKKREIKEKKEKERMDDWYD